MQLIFRTWRWFATALSFASFGIGGLLLTVLVFPLLKCFPGDERTQRYRARLAIRLSFRGFIGMMKVLGVLRYEVSGVKNLRRAQLILANHPTLIDVVFLIAFIPNANCLVKGRLLRNPFTRGPITQAGYIQNEDKGAVLSKANCAFERNEPLIVFPEGTRTTPGKDLQFKRGAAQIAVRTGVSVTPVIIECSPSTLTKQDRWYQVPHRQVQISLKFCPQVPIETYCAEPASRGARALTRFLESYFRKELSLNEVAEY